jgi:hypothetical protein
MYFSSPHACYIPFLSQPLRVTEPLTGAEKEMFLGSKVRPVRRADNLAAVCEPTIPSSHFKTETAPVTKKLCFLVIYNSGDS